jgi:DNA-binding transcriptional ArsR family regulator
MNASVVAVHRVAALIADAARVNMLDALLSGRALTAGELALIAGVSPQNASAHLAKLYEGNLIDVEVQGRLRYYRLATPQVAAALEGLAALSSGVDSRLSRLRSVDPIAFARSCYDHLAGSLAVEITSNLLHRHFLKENSSEFLVTCAGKEFFASLGIDLRDLERQRRRLARKCLDWTERRPHVAGAVGCAMLSRFRELAWIVPVRNSRALRVTVEGQHRLHQLFAISHFKRTSRR